MRILTPITGILSIPLLMAQQNTSFSFWESRDIHGYFEEQTHKDPYFDWLNLGRPSRYIFLHMSEFWNHSVIHAFGNPRVLPLNIRNDVAEFETQRAAFGRISIQDYVEKAPVDGLLILHKGSIVFEAYPRMHRHDKHINFSVSKVYASTTIGILEDRMVLDTSKPIETYFPELTNSDWEGIPVVDILDMSSGLDFAFNYPNESEGYFKAAEAYGWPKPGSGLRDPLEYFKTIKARSPSGKKFEYSGINTLILSMLVEKVTGETYSNFLEKEIWQPMGASSDGLMINVKQGRPMSDFGLSSTLRDMARFGLLFVPSGRQGHEPVVSDNHLKKIQINHNPSLLSPGSNEEKKQWNAYQWDIVRNNGDFFKGGMGGQGLWISPRQDLVIAWFGTPSKEGEINDLPAIANELTQTDLFKDN